MEMAGHFILNSGLLPNSWVSRLRIFASERTSDSSPTCLRGATPTKSLPGACGEFLTSCNRRHQAAAAVTAAMLPRRPQAAAAAAQLLPPPPPLPSCHRHRRSRRAPAATQLLLPSASAATATTKLPPLPLRCCHRHHAAIAAAAKLLPRPHRRQQGAATALLPCCHRRRCQTAVTATKLLPTPLHCHPMSHMMWRADLLERALAGTGQSQRPWRIAPMVSVA